MAFRELARKNKAISKEDCIKMLKNEYRGVLSVIGDNGYPYGTPMNHYYNEEDGCLYFHQGIGGHRLDAIKQNDKVSFCVIDKGIDEYGDGVLMFNSVVVFGRAEVVSDLKTIIDITTKLSYKFTSDTEYIQREIECFAQKTLLLKLNIEHISGKRVREE